MAVEAKLINENYNKNLKASEYVDFLDKLYTEVPHYLQQPLTFLYNVVKSGRFKGSKLLDIGSGCVIHNVASASAFYSDIILSDYVEDMCQELKNWLQGESQLKQFLDFPAELEGYTGNLEAGRQLLEKRIKNCVKQVARCDVLADNIFMEDVKPEVAPPYDLIQACWCLDAVAPDVDNFMLILKRINKLLRPGGGLIVIGDFDEGDWKLGENEFHNLEVSEDDLRRAIKESGFKIIDLEIIYYDTDKLHNDYYCLVAEKL